MIQEDDPRCQPAVQKSRPWKPNIAPANRTSVCPAPAVPPKPDVRLFRCSSLRFARIAPLYEGVETSAQLGSFIVALGFVYLSILFPLPSLLSLWPFALPLPSLTPHSAFPSLSLYAYIVAP